MTHTNHVVTRQHVKNMMDKREDKRGNYGRKGVVFYVRLEKSVFDTYFYISNAQ